MHMVGSVFVFLQQRWTKLDWTWGSTAKFIVFGVNLFDLEDISLKIPQVQNLPTDYTQIHTTASFQSILAVQVGMIMNNEPNYNS